MAQAVAEELGGIPMSPALQATLLRAREYAGGQMHREVTLEHLLLALSEDDDATAVMQACRLDLGRLRNDLAGYLGELADRVDGAAPAPVISAALTRILKYATLAAQQGRRPKIDGAIVLAAIVGDGKSMASGFLKAQGLTFEEAVRVLQQSIRDSARPAPVAATPATSPPAIAPVSVAPMSHANGPTREMPPASATPGFARAPNADDILAAARQRVMSRAPMSSFYDEPAEMDGVPGAPPAGTTIAPYAAAPAPALELPRAAMTVASPPELPGASALQTAPPAPPSWAPPPLPTAQPATAPTVHRPPLPPLMPLGPAPPRPVPAAPQPPAAPPWSPPPARTGPPPVSAAPSGLQGPAFHAPPPSPSHLPGPSQPAIEASHLSHNIPERLTLGQTQSVEVHIRRAPLSGPGANSRPAPERRDLVTARAISVRLRPAKGRFVIDQPSLETQWDKAVDASRHAGEAAVWRFTVQPVSLGRGELTLSVTARTVAADGMIMETALADQVFEVRTRRNWSRSLVYTGTLALVAVAGIVVSHFADVLFGVEPLKALMRLIFR